MAGRVAEVLHHCSGECECVTKRGRALSQEGVCCFLFVAAAVAWRTIEEKSGGSSEKKEHSSAFSSELRQCKVEVWLCVERHLY